MELTDLLQPDHLIAAYDQCDAYDDNHEYDEDLDDINLQDALYEISTYINDKGNPEKTFKISVEGFGYRNTSNQGMVIFEDGEELLQKVLPNTQCTWKVYQDGERLVVRNWHHDSPMGNEYYYIEPVSPEEYYEWKEEHA